MRWSILYLSASLALAQGTTPKPAPSEYDVHGQAGPIEIGAEYMVHSYSNGEQMFLAERYLVVEVALYPVLKTDPVDTALAKFRLRLNGKTVIAPHTPAQAAASLKQGPFQIQEPSRVSGGIGVGPLGIPIGQQPRNYPDPNNPDAPGQPRYPRAPRAPEPDPPGGIERKKVSPADVLIQTALPEGIEKGKVSGFLYFPFTGKPSSVKTLELEYEGASLKLK